MSVEPAPSGLGHALRAFRHRDFSIFFTGAVISNSGTWLQGIAVPYVLFQLTESATWVGLAKSTRNAPPQMGLVRRRK